MDFAELKDELERLHAASFGWAVSCCRQNRAEAEEVLQAVYLKILEGKAIYRGESKLQTWLFSVIRKTAISYSRSALVRRLKSGEACRLTKQIEPQVDLERSQLQERFQLALANLPARQRETLHLVFYQDLTLREAAQVMGVSIGTARRHYERGKKNLRQALDRKEVTYELRWRREENSGAVS
jgi:RNA polymerase sigma-70 factor (ECF subfamily)